MSELRQAVAARVLVNVESMREVVELEKISQDLGLPARVAARVNPDFELKGSGMKMGGGPKQFGVDVEQMPQLLAAIGRAGLDFEGFHLFAGSQNLRPESICEAQQKSFALALRLAARSKNPLRWPCAWLLTRRRRFVSSTWAVDSACRISLASSGSIWRPSATTWRNCSNAQKARCRRPDS